MLPQIYLVRHGETEWSLSGRHTGLTDVALTTRGEGQARAAGQRLRGLSLAHALVSPRLRARHTYELSGVPATAEIDPELQEWDYGEYEGLTSAEILARRPEWNLFRDGCPGGESPAQISARGDRVVARLRQAEGNIVIFSHGHFLRVLGVRWAQFPVETGQRFALTTAALCILGYEHDELAKPVINLWNEPPREGDRST